MTIPHVKAGTRPSALRQNDFIDAFNRLDVRTIERPKERTELWLFELTSDVTYPDLSGAATGYLDREPTPYASAKRMALWHHAAADIASGPINVLSYKNTVASGVETIWFPLSFHNANGYAHGHPNARTGDRVLCWWSVQSGRWEVIAPALDEWRFELKYALTPGSYATAYLRRWTGSAWLTDTDVEFTVYDPHGLYRGRAKDAYSSPHDAGSRGRAKYQRDNGHWEIFEMQPHALAIRGWATAAISGEETFTIDAVGVMNPIGGLVTDQDPGGNVTVYNVHGWTADNNAVVYAVWNETMTHWEAEQINCPA